jgi:hypothetical protein
MMNTAPKPAAAAAVENDPSRTSFGSLGKSRRVPFGQLRQRPRSDHAVRRLQAFREGRELGREAVYSCLESKSLCINIAA